MNPTKIAGGSHVAVVNGVVGFKGNKKLALMYMRGAKQMGHEAFLALAPGKNVGDKW